MGKKNSAPPAPPAAPVAGAAPAAPPAPPVEAKPKKEAKPKVERLKQNGVTRPAPGTTCCAIWDLADAESAKAGAPVKRSVIMDALKATTNEATIATQYGKWRRFHGLKGRDTANEAKQAPAAPPAPPA